MVQQRRMTAPAKGRRGCAGMKMGAFLFSLFWLVLTFAACGKKEEAVEYYDIRVESQIMEDAGENQWLLGRQYYQEEPVSLVAEKVNAEDGTPVMDKSLLKKGRELTIDTLLDIILDTDEKKTLMGDEEWTLKFLLQGSKDLWGMIDWEAGSCDFGGERFSRILQAAKQYGYPKIFDGIGMTTGFYNFETKSEMESRNHIMGGYLFDDGCHAKIGSLNSTMGINANSKHMEGAWQLLTFLLGDEAQSDESFILSSFPVNRKAFDMVAQREIEAGAIEWGTKMVGGVEIKWEASVKGNGEDLTQAKVDEMIRYLEDARPLPIRTQPLITIIVEEAADYFSGAKSEKEVIDVIQNRVQLYLNEQQNKK